MRLQPNEGISLRFNGKVPGTSLSVRPVRMHFSYDAEFGAYTPEAYERWLDQYRSWVYGAGFGWQIGVGFATYIMTTAVPITLALAVLARTGPLAATTANLPGLPAPTDAGDALGQMGDGRFLLRLVPPSPVGPAVDAEGGGIPGWVWLLLAANEALKAARVKLIDASLFGAYGGLSCLLATDLTRAGLFDALRRRHHYATTGCRMEYLLRELDDPAAAHHERLDGRGGRAAGSRGLLRPLRGHRAMEQLGVFLWRRGLQ